MLPPFYMRSLLYTVQRLCARATTMHTTLPFDAIPSGIPIVPSSKKPESPSQVCNAAQSLHGATGAVAQTCTSLAVNVLSVSPVQDRERDGATHGASATLL